MNVIEVHLRMGVRLREQALQFFEIVGDSRSGSCKAATLGIGGGRWFESHVILFFNFAIHPSQRNQRQ